MPKKLDSCIKEVKKQIKKGDIPEYYMKGGKKKKSSAYAICKASLDM